MSPRERAVALGWYRTVAGDWYLGGEMRRIGEDLRRLLVWRSWPDSWTTWCEGRPRYHITEDEALEHALLLLDVWLS